MNKKITANITMLGTDIQEFHIVNIKRVVEDANANIQLKFNVGLPTDISIKTEENNYTVGLRMRVKLNEAQTEEIYTEISGEILGSFKVVSSNEKEVMELLKYNAVPLLYQEMRSYITTITAISHNKIINLPMINFKKYFEE